MRTAAAVACCLLQAPTGSWSPDTEAWGGAAPPDWSAGHCSAVWPLPPAAQSQGESVQGETDPSLEVQGSKEDDFVGLR